MSETEFSKEELETARKLFAGPCDFVLSVAGLEQLPEANRPEVAFAGRSNVGKSSLLNALSGRKDLARTSNTPGRTQQLNFFDLGGLLYLVDMPGYGYAKVSKTQRAEWTALIFEYLKGRPNLRCVYILVDGRHGLKDSDEELMKMLDKAAVAYRVILTKCDKAPSSSPRKRGSGASEQPDSCLRRNDMVDSIQIALKKHPSAFPAILKTSALKNINIDQLRAVIAAFCD